MLCAGESDPKGLPEAGGGEPAQPTPEAAPGDDWAEAEAAFNEEPSLEGLPNLVEDMPLKGKGAEGTEPEGEQPPEAEPKVEGQAEPDPSEAPAEDATSYKGVDIWNPEGLETPEQVKERLAQIQTYVGDKTTEWKGKFDTEAGARQELSQIVAAVAADPSKLPTYLRHYQKDLEKAGMIVNLEALGAPGEEAKAEEAVNAAQKMQTEFIGKAQEYVMGAKTEEELGSRIGEMLWKVNENSSKMMQSIIPQLKKEMREEFNTAVEPMKNERVSSQRKTSWNSAVDEVSAEAGMEGIKDAVVQTIGPNGKPLIDASGVPVVPLWDFVQTQPMLMQWVRALNADPKAAADRGVTHANLMKTAYQLYSEPARIKTAAEKARETALDARKGAGEAPGPNVGTIPTEGMDWNEIEAEIGDPFVTS